MILARFAVPSFDLDNRFIGTLHCLPISAYWFAYRITDRTYFITDEPYWDTLVWGLGQ